jgi:LacI family sucrose operon transcriptional repressor
MKPMLTLSKIAKLANVSISTASKAFSMSPEVSEETRELVFSIAKKHGCFKNFFNAKYPKLVIAVICPELESLYYANIVAHLQTAFEKKNCEICVATTQFSKERGKALVDYYTKYARVDGIVIVDGASALDAAGDFPIVCLGHANENAIRIIIDKKKAIEDAVLHFSSQGIKDIGFLGEWLTTSKKNSFISAMIKHVGEYDPNLIFTGDRFADGAYETAKRIVEGGRIPRVLICAYDYLAIGAIRLFGEKGYRIPEDIALIGMDDIAEARFLTPSLSSISHNVNMLCEAAADTLVSVMMGQPYEKCTVIESVLNLRESSEIGVVK